ncbi:fibronectin type III domain-containing protein [Geomonas oryzae]|jgi:hypothetical protein|uniref:fibronectin type III domain-containing protein n=1 Tax=Geomonas oryzae TaxID=2364273 RepID=UPI00100A6E09|nr:fibronectin type III domain-containing protein [Geomonas oryzae]
MPNRFLNAVDLKLSNMSHLELGHYAINLGDAFEAHSGHQGEQAFPPPLSKPSALKGMGTNFLVLNAAAESHDVNKVAERDAMRPIVELHVAGAVQWAVMRSVLENNNSLIVNLPLQPRKKAARSAVNANVHAPQNPKVKHGVNSGTILASAAKVEKARAYYLAFCTGDPSLEESWTIMGPFDSCRKMELSGLEPGKLYYFKIRCFGKGGMSPWSEIISLRIL